MLAVGVLIAPIAGARTPGHSSSATPGASCATPEVLSVGNGSPLPVLSVTPGNHIEANNAFIPGSTSLEWLVPAGYRICSVHIQLADGSTATPTAVLPYPTPTPLGGQYEETSNPATRWSTVTITAARSAARPGASCNYPLEGTLFETLARRGPRPPVSVKVTEVAPTQLRLKLTPRSHRYALCPKAVFNLWRIGPQGQFIRPIRIPVTVHRDGSTPIVTVPADSYRQGEATNPHFNLAAGYVHIVSATTHTPKGHAHTSERIARSPGRP